MDLLNRLRPRISNLFPITSMQLLLDQWRWQVPLRRCRLQNEVHYKSAMNVAHTQHQEIFKETLQLFIFLISFYLKFYLLLLFFIFFSFEYFFINQRTPFSNIDVVQFIVLTNFVPTIQMKDSWISSIQSNLVHIKLYLFL